MKKHRICMICDFFFPNMGGVETHIWCLSQCLLERGHKVIVITHSYEDRKGIRYMTNGLKVYYVPLAVIFDQITLPTLFSFFPLFRNILIRERITIIHCHQSTSPLTNESILFGRTLGYKVCYTDHSLFGFDDIGGIHVNKILEFTLSDIDHAICVSNTCRENLVLRARLHPSIVSTIPNAVDPTKFTPNPSQRYPTNTVNIVMLSRLVYRKGIDLAAKIIPVVCKEYPFVYFIIGGDGPKKLLLEEMRERHQLHDRVELLGSVQQDQVRDVLVRGHIFLNCSLTESFCIALLEAASCGLFVVSTRVGGVPEVLPNSMINFAEPNMSSLIIALSNAILETKRIVPHDMHNRIVNMYNWMTVSERTEIIYNSMINNPQISLGIRLMRYMTVGPCYGLIACMIAIILHWMKLFWEFIYPLKSIEICPDFIPTQLNSKSKTKTNL